MLPAGYRKINLDGSRNVYCVHCHQFICTASALSGVSSATCAVCQAGFEGIELTKEQVRELRAVKIGDALLSEAAAFPPKVKDPMSPASADEIELTTNRIGYFVKALVYSLRDTVVEAAKAIPESKLIARAKRRRPIFSREIASDKPEENNEED